MSENKIDKALDELKRKELGEIKVLIVEDDAMISELVATKLIQSGCIPYSTTDGKEAVALTQQYRPDAIILDLMLPGMSGEEILTTLKADESLKEIPVIIFSNNSEKVSRSNLMALGANRYYIKANTDLNVLVSDLKILSSGGTVLKG